MNNTLNTSNTSNWREKCKVFKKLYNDINASNLMSIKDLDIWMIDEVVVTIKSLVSSIIYFNIASSNNKALTSILVSSSEYHSTKELVWDVLSDVATFEALNYFFFKSQSAEHAIRLIERRVGWVLSTYVKKMNKVFKKFQLVRVPKEMDPNEVLENVVEESNTLEETYIEEVLCKSLFIDTVNEEISRGYGDRLIALISDYAYCDSKSLLHIINRYGYKVCIKMLTETLLVEKKIDLRFVNEIEFSFKKHYSDITRSDLSKLKYRAYDDCKRIAKKYR